MNISAWREHKLKHSIQILDCTLRDGGHALEDLALEFTTKTGFTSEVRNKIFKSLEQSGIEIVEIGSITDGNQTIEEFSVFNNVSQAASSLDTGSVEQIATSIIYRDPHRHHNNIEKWRKGLPKFARVIIRHEEMAKSFEFCRILKSLDYEVFIQPMATNQYTQNELIKLVQLANEISAYALYIVDTHGVMNVVKISEIFEVFHDKLHTKTKIGLHAHDNLNLAYSNSLTFAGYRSKRDIIIDSTLYGMGLGAGNCRSELLAYSLNANHNKTYNVNNLLYGCELVEALSDGRSTWGVGLEFNISALKGVATKYVKQLRKQYNLSYAETYDALEIIPLEFRSQYSKERMEIILEHLSGEEK